MLFLQLSLLILGIQFLHRRFLKQVLPPRWGRWITPVLLLVHAPLAVYMALRLTGYATHPLGIGLRIFSRAALFFQVFTVANLLVWGALLAYWAMRRRTKRGPEPALEDPSRRAFLRGGAATGVGALAITGGLGARQAYGGPEVTRMEIFLQDLPESLDGLRLAHLSDMHAGPLVSEAVIRRWRALAEREKPELLLFTGDFVDSLPEEVTPLVEAFRAFPAPLGSFAILGNHDYFTDPRPIWTLLEHAGIRCLENRHAVVTRNGQPFVVFGLQDPMARDGRFQGIRFGPGPMPQDVALALPRDHWRLALVHRPSNWNLAQEAGAQFTLAGHTHGGQINLIPGVNSAKLLGPFTQGLYREAGKALYVSRGLGVVGLPLRLAAPPELAILTLRRAKIPALHPGRSTVD